MASASTTGHGPEPPGAAVAGSLASGDCKRASPVASGATGFGAGPRKAVANSPPRRCDSAGAAPGVGSNVTQPIPRK